MADPAHYAGSLQAYCKWLALQSSSKIRAWSADINSDVAGKQEGAIAEAVAWDYLACVTDRQRLLEVPGIGGADFVFEAGGLEFVVEVANVATASAAEKTGLTPSPTRGGFYSLLTPRLCQKLWLKERQLSHVQMPCLVFVTTLHFQASALCMDRLAVEWIMGSTPVITSRFNPATGEAEEPRETTDLDRSIFLKFRPVLNTEGNSIIEVQRRWLSGFLLGGFGPAPSGVRVYGGLHPDPKYPFDPSLLPFVPMASFDAWRQDHLSFKWTIPEAEEQEISRFYARKRLIQAGHKPLVASIEQEAAERGEPRSA